MEEYIPLPFTCWMKYKKNKKKTKKVTVSKDTEETKDITCQNKDWKFRCVL